MSKETDDAVDALLQEKFIEVTVTYAGQTKRDDWDCDAWRVTIKAPGIPIKKMETEYFTGLGHRVTKKVVGTSWATHSTYRATSGKFKGSLVHDLPVEPRAAGILYSLISDGRAREECFNEWCSNLGYDDDSIKAFNTYQACCKIGQELNATLPREVINKLNVMLEDY